MTSNPETTPALLHEEWECFCDEGYYHQWAVRDKNGDRAFTSAIHVNTKEEAEFLVSRLNAPPQSASCDRGGILKIRNGAFSVLLDAALNEQDISRDVLKEIVADLDKLLSTPTSASGETGGGCPVCGGPADNGFDRCYPPNPYYCTKCAITSSEEMVAGGAAICDRLSQVDQTDNTQALYGALDRIKRLEAELAKVQGRVGKIEENPMNIVTAALAKLGNAHGYRIRIKN